MNKTILIIIMSVCLILSGCWDQQPLRNARLVFASSFDLTEDNKILTTSDIRSLKGEVRGTENLQAANVFVEAEGNTLRDTRILMDKKLSGDFSPNKTRVLLIGDELAAKRELYPLFDILYRDPRSSLGAKVAIVEGSASELLKMNVVGEVLIGEEIFKLLQSVEVNTLAPIENVQSVCTKIFDEGQDFMLPYLSRIQNQDEYAVDVTGVALFHNQKFTGKVLRGDEPSLILLLKEERKKYARFSIKVNPDALNGQKYITIQVKKDKVHRHINIQNNRVQSVTFDLDFDVIATEYPKNKLYSKKEINELNKKISKSMTECMNQAIKKLQDANSDVLAIGRDLISFHPEVWKQMDWHSEYPNIPIKAKVNVKIVDTGIIK
ncbi:Ger(x)C family spore germination protein [Falsibacillus pallidus]|uniref:Ger(x)C family spore germination protein n=1 Tax=Falsibacillus pallidus TaxID=493781 RepID=UPI003D9871C5